MRTVIHADKSTKIAVPGMAGKVAAVAADLAVERLKLYAEIAPILTDEQKQQLAGMD